MARNTCKQIADALLRLMDQKELDSITVRELTEEANVNKKTFYYHFHSIAELLDWMCFTKIFSYTEEAQITASNWTMFLGKITTAIRSNRDYITKILSSGYSPEFLQSMSNVIGIMMESYVQQIIKNWESEHTEQMRITKTQLEYLTRYHTMAFFGVVEKWFQNGMELSDEEFTSLFLMLSGNSVFHTLELFSGMDN